jgi:cysteine desulfurase
VRIPVSKGGFVDLVKLESALNENTVLVSIIYANNEIGVIQDIPKISNIIRNFSSKLPSSVFGLPTSCPLLHIDASQAFQYLPCKVDDLGVDLMTLSAHKIYGPKGIGLLYSKNLKPLNFNLKPIIAGASQERGMRAGTENVASIVGFGEAIEIADKIRAKESTRVLKLRDYFWQKLKKNIPNVELNGSLENRLSNNINIYFPQMKAHDLLIALDMKGVAASAGSACQARLAEPSSIILSLSYEEKRASSSVRFSLGRQTIKKELDRAVREIKVITKQK